MRGYDPVFVGIIYVFDAGHKRHLGQVAAHGFVFLRLERLDAPGYLGAVGIAETGFGHELAQVRLMGEKRKTGVGELNRRLPVETHAVDQGRLGQLLVGGQLRHGRAHAFHHDLVTQVVRLLDLARSFLVKGLRERQGGRHTVERLYPELVQAPGEHGAVIHPFHIVDHLEVRASNLFFCHLDPVLRLIHNGGPLASRVEGKHHVERPDRRVTIHQGDSLFRDRERLCGHGEGLSRRAQRHGHRRKTRTKRVRWDGDALCRNRDRHRRYAHRRGRKHEERILIQSHKEHVERQLGPEGRQGLSVLGFSRLDRVSRGRTLVIVPKRNLHAFLDAELPGTLGPGRMNARIRRMRFHGFRRRRFHGLRRRRRHLLMAPDPDPLRPGRLARAAEA